MPDSPELIPLWLDWTGRVVLVIGLGEVGQRRALTFQRAGATVIGIDPMPHVVGREWGELIRNGLELRSEPYESSIYEELESGGIRPDLVLACASRVVNSDIAHDARSRGLWIASATTTESADQSAANVHLGAVAEGACVRVAVHSGNAAPALSRTLRDQIAEKWLAAADRLALEASHWRTRIINDTLLPAEKKKALLSLVGEPDLLTLESHQAGTGVAELKRRIEDMLTAQADTRGGGDGT
jgi:uroporphyrin-III C-methyltransferase/precorrin-2 dehydrogenase/sirohydrochlorin ferrochelatase